MARLSVYEPPMCCSTGVCGPDGEDKLAQFAATLDWARRNGHQVERYDLGHAPGAFASNSFVKGLLEKEGMGVLPLTLIDGEVLTKGDYPARDVVGMRLGIANDGKKASTSSCCGGAAAEPVQQSSSCCGSAPAKAEKTSCC